MVCRQSLMKYMEKHGASLAYIKYLRSKWEQSQTVGDAQGNYFIFLGKHIKSSL